MQQNDTEIIAVAEHNDTEADPVAYELSAFQLELVAGGAPSPTGTIDAKDLCLDFIKR